jgi:hypothetical protein
MCVSLTPMPFPTQIGVLHYQMYMRNKLYALVALAMLLSCKLHSFQEWHKPTKHYVSGVIDSTWTKRVGPYHLNWIRVNDTKIYVQDTTLAKGMPYQKFLKRMVK